MGGIFGAILAVPYTAMAWTLIQIWTDRYQAGHDPVLGRDPLDPKDRAASKATRSQRRTYQRLRRGRQRGSTLGAASQGAGAPQDGETQDGAAAHQGEDRPVRPDVPEEP